MPAECSTCNACKAVYFHDDGQPASRRARCQYHVMYGNGGAVQGKGGKLRMACPNLALDPEEFDDGAVETQVTPPAKSIHAVSDCPAIKYGTGNPFVKIELAKAMNASFNHPAIKAAYDGEKMALPVFQPEMFDLHESCLPKDSNELMEAARSIAAVVVAFRNPGSLPGAIKKNVQPIALNLAIGVMGCMESLKYDSASPSLKGVKDTFKYTVSPVGMSVSVNMSRECMNHLCRSSFYPTMPHQRLCQDCTV